MLCDSIFHSDAAENDDLPVKIDSVKHVLAFHTAFLPVLV